MLTLVEKALLLQHMDLFRDASSEDLSFLASIAKEEHCGPGDVIFREKDPSDAMFFIIEGKILLQRENQERFYAGRHEAIGTWALFDKEQRLMSATAIESSRLLRIDQEDFLDLMADHIEIGQSIFRALIRRMKRLIGD